jgi:hypothetical protein
MRKINQIPELSKSVGWEPQSVSWPSMSELESASDYQILKWYRFLPSAITHEQKQVQEVLYQMVRG